MPYTNDGSLTETTIVNTHVEQLPSEVKHKSIGLNVLFTSFVTASVLQLLLAFALLPSFNTRVKPNDYKYWLPVGVVTSVTVGYGVLRTLGDKRDDVYIGILIGVLMAV
jgi:hypothetical protein